jgi:diacylglycerol kinase family enzyme
MLAPHAVPDDGLFDLVLIHANQQENYLQYMTAVLMGDLDQFPNVSVQRGRHLEIAWRGFPLHLDAEVVAEMDWTEEDFESQEMDATTPLDVAGPFLQIELEKQAVNFLLPRNFLERADE